MVLDPEMIESIPKKERIVIKIDKNLKDELKDESRKSENLIAGVSEACNILKSQKSIKMAEKMLNKAEVGNKFKDEVDKQTEYPEGMKIVVKIDNNEKSPKLTRRALSTPKEKQIEDNLNPKSSNLRTEVLEGIKIVLKSPKSLKMVESTPKQEKWDDNLQSPESANLKTEVPEGIKIIFKSSDTLKSPKSLKMIESISKEKKMDDNLRSPKSEVLEEMQADFKMRNVMKSPKSLKMVESVPKEEMTSPKSEVSEQMKIVFKTDKNEKSTKILKPSQKRKESLSESTKT